MIIKIGLAVTVPILYCFLSVGIEHDLWGLAFVGAVSLLFYLIGLSFFYCYGIKITGQNITVMFHNTLRSFRLENVNYIKITFDNNSIRGEIKPFKGDVYRFEFSDFLMDPTSKMPHLFIVKVKITKHLADKMVKELSQREKVCLKSYFKSQKGE